MKNEKSNSKMLPKLQCDYSLNMSPVIVLYRKYSYYEYIVAGYKKIENNF